MRELIKLVSIVIGIFSAIVGGAVAINGYLHDIDKRLDDRKKQTFDLIALYYSAELVRARSEILANEREIVCNPESDLLRGPSRVSIFTHVEFFDTVEACIETGLCDAETARDFFAAYANWHWPILRQHIEAIRRTEAAFELKRPYGHGLEKLADRPAKYQADCGKR